MELTKDTLLIDAFRMGDAEKMAEVLYGFGMHCLGCALSRNETIGQAAEAHGVDADEMLEALKEALQ